MRLGPEGSWSRALPPQLLLPDLLSHRLQTAETVNQLAGKSQRCFGHTQLALNQQVALVQEQVDYSTVNHVMCVTHGTVLHASATVMELNRHMRGVWNTAFVNFTTQLVRARWLQHWSNSLVLSVLGILF